MQFRTAGLLVAALLLSGPAHAVSSPAEMLPDRQQETRAQEIGHQLRCLVCQNESVEESEADLARDLRRIIRERVAAGESDQQIEDWMTARYGDFVRLRPPVNALTAALWGSPVIAVAIGGGAVWLSRRRRSAPPTPLSPAERDKLTEMLRQ